MKKPRPPLERVVQRQCVAYLKARGWSVWQTSQGHKHPKGAPGLRITPGIPDLYALHPVYGAVWLEVKREGGKMSDAQQHFADLHARSTGAAVPGCVTVHSLDELRAIL